MVGKVIKSKKNEAPPAPDQEDLKTDLLMREVEEEVRREQIEKVWKQYGTYLIAGALLFVAGVGGYQLWRARTEAAAAAAGARYLDSVRLNESGKADEMTKALGEIAASGPAGYAALARLQLAAAHQKAGRTAEALAVFESLAKTRSTDVAIAEFAQLQAAAIRLDSADWTEMQNRLNDLVGEKGNWRYSARELLGLAAVKAGRTDDARRAFQELLADRKVPPSIGQRAQIMMAQIVAAELQSGGAAGTTPQAAPDAAKKP